MPWNWKTMVGALAACAVSLPAFAATFSFSQAGFSEGAAISGSFTASDSNGDGRIDLFDGEVTAFELSFSGNSNVGAFSAGLDDLFDLKFDLDGAGLLGDDGVDGEESLGVVLADVEYFAGPAPVGPCGGPAECAFVNAFQGGADVSSAFVIVEQTAVPLPGAAFALSTALFGLGAFAYRSEKRRR